MKRKTFLTTLLAPFFGLIGCAQPEKNSIESKIKLTSSTYVIAIENYNSKEIKKFARDFLAKKGCTEITLELDLIWDIKSGRRSSTTAYYLGARGNGRHAYVQIDVV